MWVIATNVQWLIMFLITVSTSAEELRPAKACTIHDTIPLNGSFLGENNTLIHNNLTYQAHQWGVYNNTEEPSGNISIDTHLRGCICQVTDCIRLCCEWGHVFDTELETCAPLPDGKPFRVLINVTHNGRTFLENLADHHDYVHRFIYEAGHCEYFSDGTLQDENKFHKNGQVSQSYMNTLTMFDHSKYCIDVFADGSTQLLFCLQPDESDSMIFAVNTVCMSVSIPFLMITFVVYAIVPQLRNIHGKSLMFYLIGLMLGYISVVVTQSSSGLEEPYCSVFAYTYYFGFVLTFFWMNVMCIDIWLTFSKPIIRIGDAQRFRYYLCYACGMPLLLLVVYLTVNYLKITNIYSPIGEGYCSFPKHGYSKLIFLYVPLGGLISANLILYLLTMIKMRQLHRETLFVRERSNRYNADDDSHLMLNTRLLIVMGVTWSLEMMTWFLPNHDLIFKIFNYLCDLCNSLQGVFIFMLFVYRQHVWKLICKRFEKERTSKQTLTRQSTTCSYVKRMDSVSMSIYQPTKDVLK